MDNPASQHFNPQPIHLSQARIVFKRAEPPLHSLARRFGHQRLEAACTRAMAIRSPTYQSIKTILNNGMDRQRAKSETAQSSLPLHDNVRGPDYYH